MSVGRTGCTLVVLGQSSHEVALRAALEPPHGHRKYIYFDSPLKEVMKIPVPKENNRDLEKVPFHV